VQERLRAAIEAQRAAEEACAAVQASRTEEIGALEQTVLSLREQVAVSEGRVGEADRARAEVEEQQAVLMENVKKLQSYAKLLEEEKTSIMAVKDEALARVSSLEAQVSQQMAAATALRERLSTMESSRQGAVGDLEAQLTALHEEVSRASESGEAAKVQIAALEGQVKAHQEGRASRCE
jgi:chromosome segregation ATPase